MKLHRISRRYYGVDCSGGRRPRSAIKTVVLHSTEGDTAAGAAAYLKHRPDGSVHIVVDDKDAFLLAPDSLIVCGAAGYNEPAIHIEQAGHSGWSPKQWRRRARTIKRAAYWTAKKLRKHDLPPRYLSVRKLNRGLRRGYTYHVNLTRSKIPGVTTTHTDPGPGYPYKLLHRTLVRFYRRR